MATSQDPGSLGVYGFRNRVDHSYDGLGIVNSRSISELAIWDQVAREGKRSVIIGVPPGYPPRKVNGISVGCFLTPDTTKDVYTHPAEVGRRDRAAGRRRTRSTSRASAPTTRPGSRDEIYAMTRKHFEVVRHFLQNARVGLLPVRRDRPRPAPARLLEVPRPRARPARARQPVQRRHPRLLPLPRRGDRQPARAARRRHGRPGRLRPRRAAARRRLLRQRVADPRGAARPEPVPREGHAVRASST